MTNGAVALHHQLAGPEDAPAVVASNSLGTTLRAWDGQAPEFSDRCLLLLRYDHRGHGGSSVSPGPYTTEDLGRDVLALLVRLAIERFSFCGLSIGRIVGMWLASEVPKRIDRLALCCMSARLGLPDMWTTRAGTVRTDGVGAIADTVMERWFTPPYRAGHAETVERGVRMLRDALPEGYAGCCEAIRDVDLRTRLGAIRVPTLLIAGADDLVTPPDYARLICDSISDARLVVIPQAAHLANTEHPVAVTQAVLYHLGSVAERRVG